MNQILWNLLKLSLWTFIWSVFGNIPCALEKNVYSLIVGCRVIYKYPLIKLVNCVIQIIQIFFFFLSFFLGGGLFRATPAAYGNSQAKGQVESELQLPAYTTATATQDPSHVFDLHHSSWQHWILNPLSKARDRTHVLMDTSWGLLPLSHHWNTFKSSLTHQKLRIFYWNLPLC